MKKVVKNILKWLLLVYVCFSFVFIIKYATENGGIVEAIYYKVITMEKPYLYNIETSQLEEAAKNYQEYANKAYEINENSNEKIKEIAGLYEKYPVGITLFLNDIARVELNSDIYIISTILGIEFGSIIFAILLVDKVVQQRKMQPNSKMIKKEKIKKSNNEKE